MEAQVPFAIQSLDSVYASQMRSGTGAISVGLDSTYQTSPAMKGAFCATATLAAQGVRSVI